jgi:hypothetical protein
MTVNMMGLPGEQYFVNGNTYTAAASGFISNVAPGDVSALIAAGCRFSNLRIDWLGPFVPLAAAANRIVTSVAAANGGLTIAAQPDVPRPLAIVLTPGAAAVTAGSLAVVYNNQQGVAITDTFSLVTGSGVNLTLNTTQGASHVTSAAITAFAGGSSPTIVIGTTASITLPLPGVFANLTVWKENVDNADETVGTLTTTGSVAASTLTANIATTTAPNATHSFTFGVAYNP